MHGGRTIRAPVSLLADPVADVADLNARETTLVFVSRAPK